MPRRPALPGGPPAPRAALLLLPLGLLSAPAAATPASPAEPTWAARAGASLQVGLVPPFFEGARDRLAAELDLRWRPVEGAWVAARADAWRADAHPDGRREAGPGDLRLATGLRSPPGPWQAEALAEVKLPNADDEAELGTDETDLRVAAGLRTRPAPLALDLHLGLDVRGDPRRSRRQDLVPQGSLALAASLGPLVPQARALVDLPTARQPGRVVFGLGAEGACPVLAGAELLVGATAAGPDLGGRAWLGWGGGCAGPGPAPSGAD